MSSSRTSQPTALDQAHAAANLPHLQAMGRRQRRAAETRLRLFRCALQLIAERGFPNVTVEDITEAADVGKGTFFNYFESKDHVLGVMAEIQLGKVREAAVRSPRKASRRFTPCCTGCCCALPRSRDAAPTWRAP